MHVCIVTHKLLKGDGQARVNYEIVKGLLRQGHRVTVLASDVAPELKNEPTLRWHKVPVFGWPTQLLKNLVFALISSLRLLMRRNQFDLLMVNGAITFAASDVNAVHFVHGSWLRSRSHPFKQKKRPGTFYQLLFTYWNSLWEKLAFRRAAHLVPVSEKVKREIRDIGCNKPMTVVANGVDIDEFRPGPGADRERLGLPLGVPLALFAGDIKSPRKNLDSVLRALANVEGLHLAVAGSTKGSPYPKLAEELSLRDRVHFLGFRDDVAELMRAADFFVFPSRYEACTLAVIEALASGLPVVTTYQSGVSELVEGSKGVAGIVLDDPEDAESLERAMRLLSRNKELREGMAVQARRIAEQQQWEAVAAQYIDVFAHVLEGKASARRDEGAHILAFATQGSGGDDEQRLKTLLSTLPVSYYPFTRRGKWKNTWNIVRTVLKERPRLVVMEGTGIAGGAALLLGRLLAGVPYVVSSGDAVGPYVAVKSRWLGPPFRLYERCLYRWATGFIGWTPYLIGRALSYGATYGMTAAGWAPYRYSEAQLRDDRSRIRQRYGIPEGQIVIGIVGSLNWNRKAGYCYGLELVQALLRLKRTDVTALIVGDGTGRSKLEELASGHPGIVIAGRVPREDVPAYLAAMDVASLPQSVDQVGSFRYSTKASEYLSVRLPIVTGRIPMAYDFNQDWLFRLPGSKPWESQYIESLASFLEGCRASDFASKSAAIPERIELFDKEAQIRAVGAFIRDILAAQEDGRTGAAKKWSKGLSA